MLIVTNAVIQSNFTLAISANTAYVNFYNSTIAVGESLDRIFSKLLQESCKLIPLYSRV